MEAMGVLGVEILKVWEMTVLALGGEVVYLISSGWDVTFLSHTNHF